MPGTLSPLGAVFSNLTTTAKQVLATIGFGQDGSEWVYVQADGAIAQYDVVYYTDAGQASKVTKATADAGRKMAVAQVAFADNEYGWLMRKSGTETAKVKVLASCAPNVRLYTTATSGSLDDTDASQTAIFGIIIRATAGASAGAGNGLTIAATIDYPHSEATA